MILGAGTDAEASGDFANLEAAVGGVVVGDELVDEGADLVANLAVELAGGFLCSVSRGLGVGWLWGRRKEIFNHRWFWFGGCGIVRRGGNAGGAAAEGFFAEEGGELGQGDWLFSGVNNGFNAGFKTH